MRQVPLARHAVRDDLPVGPLAFLGEPLERVGRVHHLALRLGQRLALLHRHVRARSSARSRIRSAVFFSTLARS